ncbi:30S ribosomal protein S16 [Sphingobacteriales bacterium UPWRP_1]|nr:30S ribosomal protein S16 [Sphingobacteriales bacterium TSM_CSM]PSJ75691.1 30S ribosomal protein S16 [Sphingobacteriales bacterium UPWRP_1]
MAVKLRLQRHGRKKRPFYHIVATDSRNRRDGKFIERIGIYNPVTSPATVDVDYDKALKWLGCGAQPTDTVRSILSAVGVMYKKHLQRGVAKGAFSQEEADRLFKKWLDERVKKGIARFNIAVSAAHAQPKTVVAAPAVEVVKEVVTTVVEEEAPQVEETVEDAENTAPETTTED